MENIRNSQFIYRFFVCIKSTLRSENCFCCPNHKIFFLSIFALLYAAVRFPHKEPFILPFLRKVDKFYGTAYNKTTKIHSGGENDAHQICVTSVPMRINIESSALCTAGVVSSNSCSPDTSQGQVSSSRCRKWMGTEEDRRCLSSLWGVFVLPSDGVKRRYPT